MSEIIEIEASVDWDEPVDEQIDQDDDGRKGLPSASEYPRMHACPGYLNLKHQLPKRKGGSGGPYAESGKRIHAALAGDAEADSQLTDEEVQVRDWCNSQWSFLEEKWLKEKGVGFSVTMEQRLFLGKTFSGQFDRTAFSFDESIALTGDFKTGRLPVPGAESNLQMRAYAVLLAVNYPKLKLIYVSVIQPWVSKEPIIAAYDAVAIRTSMLELEAVLKSSADPDAKRIPGSQCKYCPCRANCPEARAVVQKVAHQNPGALVTNTQIAEFLNIVSIAESVIEAVKKEAEARLALQQEIPGWDLAPGRTLSTITQPEIVFARVSSLGLTQEKFMGAVKIQKGALKIAVKEITGLKGKALDEKLEIILSGCTEEKTTKPYLKKQDMP